MKQHRYNREPVTLQSNLHNNPKYLLSHGKRIVSHDSKKIIHKPTPFTHSTKIDQTAPNFVSQHPAKPSVTDPMEITHSENKKQHITMLDYQRQQQRKLLIPQQQRSPLTSRFIQNPSSNSYLPRISTTHPSEHHQYDAMQINEPFYQTSNDLHSDREFHTSPDSSIIAREELSRGGNAKIVSVVMNRKRRPPLKQQINGYKGEAFPQNSNTSRSSLKNQNHTLKNLAHSEPLSDEDELLCDDEKQSETQQEYVVKIQTIKYRNYAENNGLLLKNKMKEVLLQNKINELAPQTVSAFPKIKKHFVSPWLPDVFKDKRNEANLSQSPHNPDSISSVRLLNKNLIDHKGTLLEYIVMEKGTCDLGSFISQGLCDNRRVAKNVIFQLIYNCYALQSEFYFHHMDIKPSNIIIRNPLESSQSSTNFWFYSVKTYFGDQEQVDIGSFLSEQTSAEQNEFMRKSHHYKTHCRDSAFNSEPGNHSTRTNKERFIHFCVEMSTPESSQFMPQVQLIDFGFSGLGCVNPQATNLTIYDYVEPMNGFIPGTMRYFDPYMLFFHGNLVADSQVFNRCDFKNVRLGMEYDIWCLGLTVLSILIGKFQTKGFYHPLDGFIPVGNNRNLFKTFYKEYIRVARQRIQRTNNYASKMLSKRCLELLTSICLMMKSIHGDYLPCQTKWPELKHSEIYADLCQLEELFNQFTCTNIKAFIVEKHGVKAFEMLSMLLQWSPFERSFPILIPEQNHAHSPSLMGARTNNSSSERQPLENYHYTYLWKPLFSEYFRSVRLDHKEDFVKTIQMLSEYNNMLAVNSQSKETCSKKQFRSPCNSLKPLHFVSQKTPESRIHEFYPSQYPLCYERSRWSKSLATKDNFLKYWKSHSKQLLNSFPFSVTCAAYPEDFQKLLFVEATEFYSFIGQNLVVKQFNPPHHQVSSPPRSQRLYCILCGSDNVQLSCSRCSNVFYCSQNCKTNYNSLIHKISCNKL